MRLRPLVPLAALCVLVPSLAHPQPAPHGSDRGQTLPTTLTPPGTSGIVVRVYEVDVLGAEMKSNALHIAAGTLSAAEITVIWRECPLAGVSPACQGPIAGEFVLRIVRSPAQHHDEGLPLGDTFVDTSTASAVLSTVYLDRVARVAAAADVDPAALLGYAIAHEVGHLVMASTDHSRSGLMRPVWSAAELRARRSTDWGFTAADIASMANRLSARR